MKVVLLVAVAIVVILLLGPAVGGLELGIIAALDAVAIGLVVHRDRSKGAAGT